MKFLESLGDACFSLVNGAGTVWKGTCDVLDTVSVTTLGVAGTVIKTTAKVATNAVQGTGRSIIAASKGNLGEAVCEITKTVGKGVIGTTASGIAEVGVKVGKGAGEAVGTTAKTLYNAGGHIVDTLGHTVKGTGELLTDLANIRVGDKKD